MPQGGIDEYEGALAAAQRELQEETGVTSARVVNMGSDLLLWRGDRD